MPSNENAPEPKRSNGTLIGVAAAALLVIAGIVAIGLLNEPPVAAPATTMVTTTDAPATTTTVVTTTTALAGTTEMELHPAGLGLDATLTLSVPDGWTNIGWGVGKGSGYFPMFIGYWYVENVFGNRCDSAGALIDPVPGPNIDDLTAAFVEAWGPYATAPVDATLGGWSGKYMVLTVPTPSDECPSVNMNGWMETGATPIASGGEVSRYYRAYGQVDEIWILSVDRGRNRQVVHASYAPGTSADDLAELQEVIDSTRIDLPAP